MQPLSGQCISTSTGGAVSLDTDVKELLAQHIRRPVRFAEAVQRAAAAEPALWVEVGPGGVLSSFVRDILGAKVTHCLPTDLAGEDGFHLLNNVLARAFVLGFPVATEKLFEHRFHRPFDIENYNPVFIVNPCERPVELTVPVEGLFNEMTSGLLTEGVDGEQGAEAERSRSFLRDMVALYQRHHSAQPTAEPALVPPSSIASPSAPTAGERAAEVFLNDRDALLEFAMDWVAGRIKSERSEVGPDMSLRTLDSIKVGEFVVVLRQKAGRRPKEDPAAPAYATIAEVVDMVWQEEPQNAVQSTPLPRRPDASQLAPGLGEWVRTFRMMRLPAPLEDEPSCPGLAGGTVLVVAAATSGRAAGVADSLRRKGVSVRMTDAQRLTSEAPVTEDLAALLIFAPNEQSSLLDHVTAEFDLRVEGFAAGLFHAFRWAVSARSGEGLPLRALILRAVDRDGSAPAELDAGAGFLKSLRLEHPGAVLKQVSLPGAWGPEKWADVVARELEHSGTTAVAYDAGGSRTADMAVAVESNRIPAAPPLGKEDVVLVSGGGKGITFELAEELARRTHCRLALLGSSPLPSAGEVSQSELVRNLERLKQQGIPHIYVQADVSDLAAVRDAVAVTERELGPVTGVLHGAGVTRFSTLRDKPLDEFLRCIRIKARGLYNLLMVVPPTRLKALHVTSSVLGHTGMRGQTDYTFANAWLAAAVRNVKAVYPQVHCLSLGYSVWAEIGLGQKAGAVESLRALGVTAISVKEGVAAYGQLLEAPNESSAFVITGRLTSELEASLYPWPKRLGGRFLEQVLRRIPGTEVIADATVSHQTDLYLPEHVFEGTPIFPGVMAIEGMVQAAMACAGREELPVLRNVMFRRPLLVPEDAKVIVRTLALAEQAEGDAMRVRVAMRSNGDDFHQNHFEADCWFGLPAPSPETLPPCPTLPEPLDHDPEEFSPVPLFQGKFLRRITGTRRRDLNKESLTDLEIPVDEVYFNGTWTQAPATPSPALRDSMLQSGAIVLPPASLPVSFGEIRFHKPLGRGGGLHCQALVTSVSPTRSSVNIASFDQSGALVETLTDLVLQTPVAGTRMSARQSKLPISFRRVASDLRSLLCGQRHGLAFAPHDGMAAASSEDGEIVQGISAARRRSTIANLAAAREAVAVLCANHGDGIRTDPSRVRLGQRPGGGMPELLIADAGPASALRGVGVSVSDMEGLSVALVGEGRVGVDIEVVAKRNAELWRHLLGADGYGLALQLTRETGERFDYAATRVWGLIEAGKKACELKLIVPQFTGSVGEPWLSFAAPSHVDYLCSVFEPEGGTGTHIVFAVAFNRVGAGI